MKKEVELKPDEYKLKLELTSDGLHAEENRLSGYFGMNVAFVGDYKKV